METARLRYAKRESVNSHAFADRGNRVHGTESVQFEVQAASMNGGVVSLAPVYVRVIGCARQMKLSPGNLLDEQGFFRLPTFLFTLLVVCLLRTALSASSPLSLFP